MGKQVETTLKMIWMIWGWGCLSCWGVNGAIKTINKYRRDAGGMLFHGQLIQGGARQIPKNGHMYIHASTCVYVYIYILLYMYTKIYHIYNYIYIYKNIYYFYNYMYIYIYT